MVKTTNALLLFLFFCLPSFALERVSGYCSQGGVQGQIQFSTAVVTPKFQASYPGCTLNVYQVGTTTHITIYSDINSTPKTNPFAGDAKTGYWFFYVDGNTYTQVDVNLSGAGISTPFTLTMESGGGASGTGNVSTSSNMVNGNVPKSTGSATLADGGQVYPNAPFADTTSSQILTHKDLTSNTNSFSLDGSDITSGTIPVARIPILNQNTTGKSATTDAFAIAPTGCAANFVATGIDIHGNPISCANGGCLNIINYGGNNSGTGSNTTAFNLLVAASTPDNVCAYFPAGRYAFSTTPQWTAPTTTSAITIKGDGANVTQIISPSGVQGMVLNMLGDSNSFHVKDLSFRTSGVGTGNGIWVINSGAQNEGISSEITNVSFYGADCAACTDYWANAIVLNAFSVVNINGVKIVGAPTSPTTGSGIGILLVTTTTTVPVVFNLDQVTVDYVDQGLQIGDYVQGVTVDHSNFTGVTTGINVPNSETHGLDQLMVAHTQINAATNAINIQSIYNNVMLDNNYFLVGGSAVGVNIDATYSFSITNNHFLNIGGGGNGLVIGPLGTPGPKIINGNTFQGFTTATWLQTGSSGVTVGFGSYLSNTTNILDNGSSNTIPASCAAGTPSSSFAVVNGIITHC